MEQAYNRIFELHGEKEAWISSDEQMLKQLFFIILDNARKYSEQRIIVNIEQEQQAYKVSIRDFGHGIASEQLPHLFERFYRVGEDQP